MLLAVCATAGVIFWPLARALGRRMEGGGAAGLEQELDGLRNRVDQLEQGQGRLAELEERLDFAERLLAQSREPDRLQR
jgi:hypothetical protein